MVEGELRLPDGLPLTPIVRGATVPAARTVHWQGEYIPIQQLYMVTTIECIVYSSVFLSLVFYHSLPIKNGIVLFQNS